MQLSKLLLFIFLSVSVFGKQKVYLIHGYASPKAIMNKINKSLIQNNYVTENFDYSSLTQHLGTVGENLYLNIKHSSGVDTVMFVTHSMGALVVRSMLQYSMPDTNFPVIYRIVMIAPPNGGAEIADFYSSIKILQKILGPNINNMRTDSGSYANKLPKPYKSEVGIIIGIRDKGKGFNPFIKGENDGYLTPNRTTLGIEKDIAIVTAEHAFLTQNKLVRKLVLEFLHFGKFISKTDI